jgi:hypothetical protein
LAIFINYHESNNSGDLMVRRGRTTELIVEELEKIGLNKDICKIRSPDQIKDVVTGRMREVDISIRCKIGTFEFLTIIENRNRKNVDDVTWVEQVKTKKEDLRAEKALMVTTSGFTAPAIKKAKHNGIILRVLRDFRADELIDWMNNFIFKTQALNLDIKSLIMVFENVEDVFLFQINVCDKKFKFETDGEYVCLADIISSQTQKYRDYFYNDLKWDGPPVNKALKIDIDPSNKIVFEHENEIYYLNTIDVVLACSLNTKTVPIKGVKRYEENENPIIDKAEYQISTHDKGDILVSVVQNYKKGEGFIKLNNPEKAK